jgi:hypothetical protein
VAAVGIFAFSSLSFAHSAAVVKSKIWLIEMTAIKSAGAVRVFEMLT